MAFRGSCARVAPWRDLPERYGPWQSVDDRFRRWTRAGVWPRLLFCCAGAGAGCRPDRLGGGFRGGHLHQGASASGRCGGKKICSQEALGRSRGGLTSKLHLLCEKGGKALVVLAADGQRHEELVSGAAAWMPPCAALAICWPSAAFPYQRCRALLRRRHIKACIPERRDQKERRKAKGRRGGRAPAFDAQRYKGRNVVERRALHLKQSRRIATRHDKLAASFHAFATLANLRQWLRCQLPDTL